MTGQLPQDISWGPLVFEARRFVELRKKTFSGKARDSGAVCETCVHELQRRRVKWRHLSCDKAFRYGLLTWLTTIPQSSLAACLPLFFRLCD